MNLKGLVKSIIEFRNNNNPANFNLVNLYTTHIKHDIISAFEMSKTLINENSKLFSQSTSFFNFLLQLANIPHNNELMKQNDTLHFHNSNNNADEELHEKGTQELTKQELTETQQELTETQQELTEAKQKLTEAKQKLTEAKQELTKTQQELTKTQQELNSLKANSLNADLNAECRVNCDSLKKWVEENGSKSSSETLIQKIESLFKILNKFNFEQSFDNLFQSLNDLNNLTQEYSELRNWIIDQFKLNNNCRASQLIENLKDKFKEIGENECSTEYESIKDWATNNFNMIDFSACDMKYHIDTIIKNIFNFFKDLNKIFKGNIIFDSDNMFKTLNELNFNLFLQEIEKHYNESLQCSVYENKLEGYEKIQSWAMEYEQIKKWAQIYLNMSVFSAENMIQRITNFVQKFYDYFTKMNDILNENIPLSDNDAFASLNLINTKLILEATQRYYHEAAQPVEIQHPAMESQLMLDYHQNMPQILIALNSIEVEDLKVGQNNVEFYLEKIKILKDMWFFVKNFKEQMEDFYNDEFESFDDLVKQYKIIFQFAKDITSYKSKNEIENYVEIINAFRSSFKNKRNLFPSFPLKETTKSLKNENEKLKETMQSYITKLKECEQSSENKLKHCEESYRTKLDTYQKEIAERENQIKGYQQEIAVRDNNIEACQQEIAVGNNNIEACKQEIAAKNNKIEACLRDRTRNLKRIQENQKELAAQKAQLELCEQKLETYKEELSNLNIQLEAYKAKQNTDHEELITQTQKLQEDNENLRKYIAARGELPDYERGSKKRVLDRETETDAKTLKLQFPQDASSEEMEVTLDLSIQNLKVLFNALFKHYFVMFGKSLQGKTIQGIDDALFKLKNLLINLEKSLEKPQSMYAHILLRFIMDLLDTVIDSSPALVISKGTIPTLLQQTINETKDYISELNMAEELERFFKLRLSEFKFSRDNNMQRAQDVSAVFKHLKDIFGTSEMSHLLDILEKLKNTILQLQSSKYPQMKTHEIIQSLVEKSI